MLCQSSSELPAEHSLITKPVSKVHALDLVRGPSVAGDKGDCVEHVLDVAMTPVLPFYSGDGGNI